MSMADADFLLLKGRPRGFRPLIFPTVSSATLVDIPTNRSASWGATIGGWRSNTRITQKKTETMYLYVLLL